MAIHTFASHLLPKVTRTYESGLKQRYRQS